MSMNYVTPTEIHNQNEIIMFIRNPNEEETRGMGLTSSEERFVTIMYYDGQHIAIHHEIIPIKILKSVTLYRLQNYQRIPIFRIKATESLKEFVEPIRDNPFREDLSIEYVGGD